MTAVNKKSRVKSMKQPTLKICNAFLTILPKYSHKGKGNTVPLHVMMAYWGKSRSIVSLTLNLRTTYQALQ
jgi:hypothetical protein